MELAKFGTQLVPQTRESLAHLDSKNASMVFAGLPHTALNFLIMDVPISNAPTEVALSLGHLVNALQESFFATMELAWSMDLAAGQTAPSLPQLSSLHKIKLPPFPLLLLQLPLFQLPLLLLPQ
jgi:hypothetical protein